MNAPLAKDQLALLMSDSLTYRASGRASGRAPGTVRPTLWQAARSAMSGAFARLRDMPRRRAVLGELATLTDRELADIGLHRSELSRVFDPRFAQARAHFN